MKKKNVQPGAPHAQRVAKRTTGRKSALTKRRAQENTAKQKRRTAKSSHKKTSESGTVKSEPKEMYREFEQLNFNAIHQPKDERTEIITELKIKLPNRPGTHILKAKVDTGAEGNTLPLRTFRNMFPNRVDDLGQPIPGSTKKEHTILTAYNGSNIIQHGSIYIQCGHKDKWKTLKFFVVTTEGPTIIGLPSLRDLELISLHCTIQQKKDPINSVIELKNAYASQFDRIRHFKSDYHIVLKSDHPTKH